VRLEDAGKRYTKYDDTPMLLSSALKVRHGSRRSKLWALRHVDLEVAPGEAVGVIGRNGAGKSTMLRILAGITAPTEGSVTVRGRVAPLIAVGVGFHQELSGRENVYVNGTILGMSDAEIRRRFDSIVAFAEIEEFIDTPVKFYSSGMFVRLGFAVAVAASPDVLLVDEVLAVGDIAFQMKCYERIREMQADGTTLLLVSHNLNAVRRMCDRVLVIRSGQPVFLGPGDDAITAYYSSAGAAPEDAEGAVGDAAAPVEIIGFEMLDAAGVPTGYHRSGDEVRFTMRTRFRERVENPVFAVALSTVAGIPVYIDSTYEDGSGIFAAGQEATADFRFRAPLATGDFTVRGSVRWTEDPNDRVTSQTVQFHTTGPPLVSGVVDLGGSWKISE
jgi:ABC-type polysaccharide/polyol phosphate transport system ATPase subunit